MKLDKTIEPESLFGKRQVIADILVVYTIDEAGNRVPSELHLLRLNPPKKGRTK